MSDLFGLESYLVRRKVLELFGAGFKVFDEVGTVVAYSAPKAVQ